MQRDLRESCASTAVRLPGAAGLARPSVIERFARRGSASSRSSRRSPVSIRLQSEGCYSPEQFRRGIDVSPTFIADLLTEHADPVPQNRSPHVDRQGVVVALHRVLVIAGRRCCCPVAGHQDEVKAWVATELGYELQFAT